MSARKTPNRASGDDPDDIVAAVRKIIADLPAATGLHRAIQEGEQIADILDPLGLPSEIIAAVRIYPLCREKFIDNNYLINNNLPAISRLVLGLEQLNQFSLPENWQPGEALAVRQSEALRKMLLAIVSDVRLVLVRIAEQLYRLRQARNAPRAIQQALAQETREIYAALANRLGVWQLKWELEDFAFRYLDPDTYSGIAKALKEKRVEREEFIHAVKATLDKELDKQHIAASITGRPKHIYSIWRKMQRKGQGLDSLYDIRAVRILVDDVSACYAALGIVHNLWSYIPGEFDDYIANPKENDYQSLHTTVVGPGGKTVEVQIRTRVMHHRAEFGIAAHWSYKEAPAPAEELGWLQQMVDWQSETDDPAAFMRALNLDLRTAEAPAVPNVAQLREGVGRDHLRPGAKVLFMDSTHHLRVGLIGNCTSGRGIHRAAQSGDLAANRSIKNDDLLLA